MDILQELITPEELLAYLEKNTIYGYIGKNNQKYYSGNDSDYGRDFLEEYHLQTPEELLQSSAGICWDFAELERAWFTQHDYEFKVFAMVVIPQNNKIHNQLITHTFLAYKVGEKWYWFEYAFAKQRGIHEFNDIDSLIETVKARQLDYVRDHNVSDGLNNIKVWEYAQPRHSSAEEIIKQFTNKISERGLS